MQQNAFPPPTTVHCCWSVLCHTTTGPVNENDINELLFYHNAIRASVEPPAANMRQMVYFQIPNPFITAQICIIMSVNLNLILIL